jgi:hypothetical protein
MIELNNNDAAMEMKKFIRTKKLEKDSQLLERKEVKLKK